MVVEYRILHSPLSKMSYTEAPLRNKGSIKVTRKDNINERLSTYIQYHTVRTLR